MQACYVSSQLSINSVVVSIAWMILGGTIEYRTASLEKS